MTFIASRKSTAWWRVLREGHFTILKSIQLYKNYYSKNEETVGYIAEVDAIITLVIYPSRTATSSYTQDKGTPNHQFVITFFSLEVLK